MENQQNQPHQPLPPLPPPPRLFSTSITFPSDTNTFFSALSIQSEYLRHLTITDCPSSLSTVRLLTSERFQSAIKKFPDLISINAKISGDFQPHNILPPSVLEYSEQEKLLLSYQSMEDEHNTVIYCFNDKSSEVSKFLFAGEVSESVTAFVLDFLIETLEENVSAQFPVYESIKTSLLCIRDNRGYNLLMHAVEIEHEPTVDELLKLNFDLNETNSAHKTAADIAWQRVSHGILLKLLEANSPYPRDFDIELASVAIKNFTRIADGTMEVVEQGNEPLLRRIVGAFPFKRHFYDAGNRSAVTAALASQNAQIYSLLVDKGRGAGPMEDLTGLYATLSDDDGPTRPEKLRKIDVTEVNNANAREYDDSYFHRHLGSAAASHDNHVNPLLTHDKNEIFKAINEDEDGRLILKVTATCADFKTIIDHHSKSVHRMCPHQTTTADVGFTNIERRHTYVAADKMNHLSAVAATTKHEHLHTALVLVFRNEGKPYGIDDRVNYEAFVAAVSECEASKHLEDLIRFAFGYEKTLWHAELAVRPAHMIAEYRNDPDRLAFCRQTFPKLFNYHEKVIMGEMRAALPVLKILSNDSKNIAFDELTRHMKSAIVHSRVNYQGQSVKFIHIISSQSSFIYQNLPSHHIREFLNEDRDLTIGSRQELNLPTVYIERLFAIKNEKFFITNVKARAKESKLVLLSDHAGCGKTTTFKHIAVKLKEDSRDHWVYYIDLKRSLRIYDKYKTTFLNASQVLMEVMGIGDDQLSSAVFHECFNHNRVILLYDGVDEIAPVYKEFFINLIRTVKTLTGNQQWIATRPTHKEELETTFGIKGYTLDTFSVYDIKLMIRSVLITESTDSSDDRVAEIYEYIDSMKSVFTEIDNPLLIQMITELYVDSEVPLEQMGLYDVYSRIVVKKFGIVGEKGRVVQDDRDNDAMLPIRTVHQVFAVVLLSVADLNDIVTLLPGLRLWRRDKRNWNPGKISRYGFLFVDHWGTAEEFPNFTHRTFAEFFLAKFLIERLYLLECDDEISLDELKAVIKLALGVSSFDFVCTLMKSFVDRERRERELNPMVLEALKARDFKDYFHQHATNKSDESHIFLFLSLLSDDRAVVREIFKYSDEVTLFQHCLVRADAVMAIASLVVIFKGCRDLNWQDCFGYRIREEFKQGFVSELEKKKSEIGDRDGYHNRIFVHLLKILDIPNAHLQLFFMNNTKHFIHTLCRSPTTGREFLDKLQQIHMSKERICDMMCFDYFTPKHSRVDLDDGGVFAEFLARLELMMDCDRELMRKFLLNENSFIHYHRIYANVPGLMELLMRYCRVDEIQSLVLSIASRMCDNILFSNDDAVNGFCQFLLLLFGTEGIKRFLECRVDESNSALDFIKSRAVKYKRYKLFFSNLVGGNSVCK